MSCDTLVVAAFYPELEPLRCVLGDGMAVLLGDVNVAAREVGIGLPMAAVGAAMQIAETQARAVVVIGTCGAYVGAGLAMGDVVVATRIDLVDPSALDGTAQFPAPMTVATHPDTGMALALERAGARPARLASTLAITVNDALAARIARQTRAQAEHLEAHGVATACAARDIPFAAVLGVANYVGKRAREEWQGHNRAAAAAAAEVVLRWIRGGAPR